MPCFGKIRVMIWYTFAIIVIQVGIAFQYAAFFGIIGKCIHSDVRMDIFASYTKKGCILECYANLYYDMCRCIPYHYPDFTKAWHVNSTTCDYNGLKCLSTVKGKFL